MAAARASRLLDLLLGAHPAAGRGGSLGGRHDEVALEHGHVDLERADDAADVGTPTGALDEVAHPAVQARELLGGLVTLRAGRDEGIWSRVRSIPARTRVIRWVASAAPGAREARAWRVRVSESSSRHASGRLTASEPLDGSERCSVVLESSRPWIRVESRSASTGPTRPPSKVVSSRVRRSLTAFQKVSATVRSVVIATCSACESLEDGAVDLAEVGATLGDPLAQRVEVGLGLAGLDGHAEPTGRRRSDGARVGVALRHCAHRP